MDPENSQNESADGEWNSVGRGGKGGKKQKKKMKNARTITLQTFISENGGWTPDYLNGGNDGEESQRDSLDLSEDEQVVKTSLLSFFTDLLRRLGPVKRDDVRMKSELDAVSDQGQRLIKRYGSLRDFLIQDESIVIIDDYICLENDTETARRLALTQAIEKARSLDLNSSSVSFDSSSVVPSTMGGITISPASTASNSTTSSSFIRPLGISSIISTTVKTNVWNTLKSVPSTSSGSIIAPPTEVNHDSIEALLQMPQPGADSLFEYKKVVNPIQPPIKQPVSIPSSFPVPPPPLKSGGNEDKVTSELLKQVNDKDKVVQTLTNVIAEAGVKREKLEEDLKRVKNDLVKSKLEKEEVVKELGRTSTSAVLNLQKQLEKEILNSRNLQHQLEAERTTSNRLLEKYNALLKFCTMSGLNPGSFFLSASTQPIAAPLLQSTTLSTTPTTSSSKVSQDVLGLRSIWNNSGKDQRQNFSSSAGSILMSKGSTSYGGLHQTQHQQQPPLSSVNNYMNLFAASPFDYGGVFAPINPAPVQQAPPPLTSASSLATSSSTSSSGSSSLYGSHKCL